MEVQVQQEAPAARPEKKPKERCKTARRSARLKLTKFDKDAARLVQSGVVSLEDVCSRLGVDRTAAETRLAQLVEKGFFVRGQQTGFFGLSVEGYNKFAPKLKQEGVKPQEKTDLIEVFSKEAKKAEVKPTIKPPAPKPDVDLGELLRKGASSSSQASKDVCELCRVEFKVSVKEPNAGKFAHCVCGAAYHKDCYHAILQGGRCARCGRKPSMVLDKSAEDAVKGIKDAFE